MDKLNNKIEPFKLITQFGENYEITEGGSLGLLALGYVGVMLWREKIASLRIKHNTTSGY